MAFKMKGSPAKMGTIQGTAGHRSALKSYASSPMKQSSTTNHLKVKKAKSYSEAYKKADKSKYKTEADFTKAAKAYNAKKYGTTEPTKAAKKYLGTNSETGGSIITTKSSKAALAKEHTTTTPEYKAKIKVEEDNKLKASKERNEKDIKSGKAKTIVSPVTGKEAIDYRKPSPKTKKRTKTGKLGVKIANIFRKKGKKVDPHRKVVKKKNNKAGTKKSIKKATIAQGLASGLTKKESKDAFKTAKKSVKAAKGK